MNMKYQSKKLKGHPNMSCEVRLFPDGLIQLVSYSTVVVEARPNYDEYGTEYCIVPAGQFWRDDIVYTPTTARHISYFLNEYFEGVSYPEFKQVALKDGFMYSPALKKGVTMYAY